MASATTLLHQQQQQSQQQEHQIELMCRICAVDFKIATEGVPIFSTEQLMDKIKNYLHIQVSGNWNGNFFAWTTNRIYEIQFDIQTTMKWKYSKLVT